MKSEDAVMSEDIEHFIKQQKTKLAAERNNTQDILQEVLARSPESAGLNLGDGQNQRIKKLQEERQQEYNDLLAKSPSILKKRPPTPENVGFPVGSYSQRRKSLEEQRHQEYNEFLKQKQTLPSRREHTDPQIMSNRKENRAPVRPETPEVPLSLKLGSYEEKRKKLQEERKREYNELKNGNVAARIQQPKPLAERRVREPTQIDDDDDADFRQYLRDREPRRGWATPTYDEILEKKRQEERSYRRNNQPEIYNDRPFPLNLRTSISDGNLNKYDDEPLSQRFGDLDKEYERKRVRFNEDRRRPSNQPDPETEFSQLKDNMQRDYDIIDSILRKYQRDSNPKNDSSRRDSYPQPSRYDALISPRDIRTEPEYRRNQTQATPRFQERVPQTTQPIAANPRNASAPNPVGSGAGTFAFGNNVRASEAAKKKAAYANELRQQMQQTKENRHRDRVQEMRGNSASVLNSHRGSAPHAVLPQQPYPVAAAPQVMPASVMPPAAYPAPYLPYGAMPNQIHEPGILDRGWGQTVYSSPMQQPPTLYPNQAPLIPQSYASPSDNLYAYFADNDPLTTSPFRDGNVMPGSVPVTSNNVGNPAAPAQRAQPATGLNFTFGESNDRQKAKEKHINYNEELKKQIEETKRRKDEDKRKREAYERKKDEEIRNYDPFGKGGGGAPMKDRFGNMITDLRQMHLDNEQYVPIDSRIHTSPVMPAFETKLATEDPPSFARGGNGIFGEGKTNMQKTQQQLYQDELKKQIEEKKKEDAERKKKKVPTATLR